MIVKRRHHGAARHRKIDQQVLAALLTADAINAAEVCKRVGTYPDDGVVRYSLRRLMREGKILQETRPTPHSRANGGKAHFYRRADDNDQPGTRAAVSGGTGNSEHRDLGQGGDR